MSHNMSPALENERAALASLIQAYSCVPRDSHMCHRFVLLYLMVPAFLGVFLD